MDVSSIDERFQSVFYDHRFRSLKQKQKKIKIDRRFLSMFTDDKFKLQYHVDKRGRPIHDSTSENLKKYYRISKKERKRLKLQRKEERNRLNNILLEKQDSNTDVLNEFEETPGAYGNVDNQLDNISDKSLSSSDDESDDYSEDESDSEIDLARGEGNIESSSEDDDDEDEEVEMLDDVRHNWDQLDNDADRSDDISRRLALCNMNWDRIKADDLMILFNGFKPAGGTILNVTIYPSDFGAKRLAEEHVHGPAELTGNNKILDDKESERHLNEKIREHQVNRLKYYYAVIECDSKETAETIYKECDGIEYESSSAKLDIRFIPDEMAFGDHPPKDVCDHVPDKDQYKHSNFVTTALNQAKVNLTWEETDQNRVKMLTRKYTEADLADMDMRDFLASSSDEEEDENDEDTIVNKDEEFSNRKIGISSKTTDQDQIARYRNLLLGEMEGDDEEDKPDDVDMEITFEPTLDELEDDDEKEQNENSSEDNLEDNDDLDDVKKDSSKSKTKKRKSRKEEEEYEVDPKKKAELEMLMLDAEDSKLKHFDINQIIKDQKMSKKKKRKLGKSITEDDFKLNMNDPRFAAVFTSSAFAVDPNNPSFRKTEAMKGLIEERLHRVHGSNAEDEIPTEAAPIIQDETTNPNLNKKKNVDAIKLKAKKQFEKKKSKKVLPKLNRKMTS